MIIDNFNEYHICKFCLGGLNEDSECFCTMPMKTIPKPNNDVIIAKAKEKGISVSDVLALIDLNNRGN